MIRRVLLASLIGLSVLVASCGGPSRAARPALSQENANRTLKLARELAETTRKCEALRAQVTVGEEYALGSAVAMHWVRQGGGLMLASEPEQRMHRELNLIGQNLAAQSARPTLEWTFGVVEDPEVVNAASAPGGYVLVTRGLLRAVDSEAQLAGVLAHEIAHVVLKHAMTRYDEVKIGQCKVAANIRFSQRMFRQVNQDIMPPELLRLLDTLESTGVLPLDKDPSLLERLTEPLVEQLVQEGHAHEDEFAADAMALQLIASAGYDAREYIAFLGKLPEGRGYAHHPSPRERQERLVALLDAPRGPDEFPSFPVPARGSAKRSLPVEFAAATR